MILFNVQSHYCCHHLFVHLPLSLEGSFCHLHCYLINNLILVHKNVKAPLVFLAVHLLQFSHNKYCPHVDLLGKIQTSCLPISTNFSSLFTNTLCTLSFHVLVASVFCLSHSMASFLSLYNGTVVLIYQFSGTPSPLSLFFMALVSSLSPTFFYSFQ